MPLPTVRERLLHPIPAETSGWISLRKARSTKASQARTKTIVLCRWSASNATVHYSMKISFLRR